MAGIFSPSTNAAELLLYLRERERERERERMGANGTSYGSLPVKNVQDLAAALDDLTSEAFKRYDRPDIKDCPVRDGDDIPVIDFSRLLDPEFEEEEISRLRVACEEWGFFQLVGHGVSDELIERMKDVIQEFFQLPLEEKQTYAQVPDDIEGYGQVFVVSEDQKLDWADVLLIRTQPVTIRKMNFWPTNPPTFSDTLDNYTLKLKEVAHKLFRLIAKSLGAQSPQKFADMFGIQTVRINYYPPCPHSDKVLGISPHSDGSAITLLLQVNEVQGLQIKKDGAWVPIKPLPGAFVVNIGNVVEVLSNGKYKSIEHRAVIDPKKERLSIATFHNVNMGSIVGPHPEIVKGGEENYETMMIEDFMKLYFSSKLDGKNFVNRLKLKK